jgi:hypothetical protein
MFRIDSDGAVSSLPTPESAGATTGYFQEGDPGTGVQATQVSADWCNTMQEEIANVVSYAGLTLSKVDNTQLLQALKLIAGQLSSTTTTTDASNTVAHSVAVAQNEVWAVEATVVGRKTSGADRIMAVVKGLFYRNGANVTQQGSTSVPFEEQSDATWGGVDLIANTSSQSVDVQVTGKAATTINWKVSVRAIKVL